MWSGGADEGEREREWGRGDFVINLSVPIDFMVTVFGDIQAYLHISWVYVQA